MNTFWDQLVRRALLGTERDPSPLIGTDGELGAAVDELELDEPEAMLLSAAALASVYRRSGRAAFEPTTRAASIAPPEDRRTIGQHAARDARALLSDPRYRDLLPEWLEAVAAAELVVAPPLLPALLDMGGRTRDFAKLVRNVIGHRGHWLASLNPKWSYIAESGAVHADDISERWETASPPERTLLFARLRETDPAGARVRIEEAWKTEAARDRAAYVEAMIGALSMDDEPFLEAQLDDVSKEVRRSAARMLGHLAGSRFAKRMAARALSLISIDIDTIVVGLPDAVDEAAARDGIVARSSSDEGGRRTWWLSQILGATPPSTFTTQFKRTPDELLELAEKSEWRRTLEGGFVTGAAAYSELDFIEALIRHRVGGEDALWNILPRDRREALFVDLLSEAKGRLATHRVLFHVPKISGPWAPELSKRIIDALAVLVATEERLGEFPAFSVLRDVGKKLTPDAHGALRAVYARIPESSYWKTALQDGVQTLERRASMLAALREEPT